MWQVLPFLHLGPLCLFWNGWKRKHSILSTDELRTGEKGAHGVTRNKELDWCNQVNQLAMEWLWTTGTKSLLCNFLSLTIKLSVNYFSLLFPSSLFLWSKVRNYIMSTCTVYMHYVGTAFILVLTDGWLISMCIVQAFPFHLSTLNPNKPTKRKINEKQNRTNKNIGDLC